MNRSWLYAICIVSFIYPLCILGTGLGARMAMACNKPSSGHHCQWKHCPYKGIEVGEWDREVTAYVGERLTNAWYMDMLHLEFPKDDYDKLESRLINDMADIDMEGLKILSWDKDDEGLITASWEYEDGRIGGTDWTTKDWIPKMIKEQGSWPECADSECRHVRPPDQDEEKCWRHFPIPEVRGITEEL